MLLLKLLLIIAFIIISIQDIKERMVSWFLFPIVGFTSAILFYKNTLLELFLTSVIINILFVFILFITIYCYAKLKMRSNFSSVFGLGDVLLFIALSFSFSSVSFIVVFIFSLIFSLLTHVFIKQKKKTIPLAGYMSLFFGVTYISFWIGITNNIYVL